MTLFDESDSQGILDNPFKEGERCWRQGETLIGIDRVNCKTLAPAG